MFEWAAVRGGMEIEKLLRMLVGKQSNLALTILVYAKKVGPEGFVFAELLDEFGNLMDKSPSRATSYRIALKMRRIGLLSYSYGRWFISDEYANACKRVYNLWKEWRKS